MDLPNIQKDARLLKSYSLYAAAQSVDAARQSLKTAQGLCSEHSDYQQLFWIEAELTRCQAALQKLADQLAGDAK